MSDALAPLQLDRSKSFTAWKAALWYRQQMRTGQWVPRFLNARVHVEAGFPCTGVSASWCPNCGDCTCARDEDGAVIDYEDDCPLHAPDSPHAENVVD